MLKSGESGHALCGLQDMSICVCVGILASF